MTCTNTNDVNTYMSMLRLPIQQISNRLSEQSTHGMANSTLQQRVDNQTKYMRLAEMFKLLSQISAMTVSCMSNVTFSMSTESAMGGLSQGNTMHMPFGVATATAGPSTAIFHQQQPFSVTQQMPMPVSAPPLPPFGIPGYQYELPRTASNNATFTQNAQTHFLPGAPPLPSASQSTASTTEPKSAGSAKTSSAKTTPTGEDGFFSSFAGAFDKKSKTKSKKK